MHSSLRDLISNTWYQYCVLPAIAKSEHRLPRSPPSFHSLRFSLYMISCHRIFCKSLYLYHYNWLYLSYEDYCISFSTITIISELYQMILLLSLSSTSPNNPYTFVYRNDVCWVGYLKDCYVDLLKMPICFDLEIDAYLMLD